MSVVGIDLGSQSTKIGVARNKGIDIVRIIRLLSRKMVLFFRVKLLTFVSLVVRSQMKFPTDKRRKYLGKKKKNLFYYNLPCEQSVDVYASF